MGRLKQQLPDEEILDDSPRGPGDPDYYGYPGEPVTPPANTKGGNSNNGTERDATTETIPF